MTKSKKRSPRRPKVMSIEQLGLVAGGAPAGPVRAKAVVATRSVGVSAGGGPTTRISPKIGMARSTGGG